jgi:hypothetical protein
MPFHLPTVFVNAGLSPTVRHPVSPVPERKRMQMPKPVRYRIKGTQSFTEMLQCLTEMSDAEIPMPAASALMHQQN